MKRYVNPRGTLLFVAIAVVLMLVIYFLSDGRLFVSTPESVELSGLDKPKEIHVTLKSPKENFETVIPPEMNDNEFNEVVAAYTSPQPEFGPEKEEPAKPDKQPEIAKRAPEYEPIIATGSPKIAIIIDDMGVDRRRSFEVIELDAPLTLAFLPYAADLKGITRQAKDRGHELMIHMPMQAMTNPVSLGPIALKEGMDETAVKANMEAAFESFEGYVGVNNHMGSKVTQNPQIMDWTMESLKDRGLYFIDSKTISTSVGAETARLNGLPTAERDVFLDHENTAAFVSGALRKLEETAMRKGYAIAIGHPKDVTIEGLKAWLPDAQARGFEIVHAGALVEKPKTGFSMFRIASKMEHEPVQDIAKREPAAGLASKQEQKIKEEPDPNSAEARETILKELLGQSQ